MKGLFKSVFRRLVFNNKTPKSFPVTRIQDLEIVEKVILKLPGSTLDISQIHCISGHEPFCIAIWIGPGQQNEIKKDSSEILVMRKDSVCAKLSISFKHSIDVNDHCVMIFTVEDANCFQTSLLRQLLFRRYFKNKNTAVQDKMYSGMYSYPRKVIAVSYQEKDYYNLFPMDFQCFISSHNIYILGLRTTNITLGKILVAKKLVISDTHAANLKDIYFLGSHHSIKPPGFNELPFTVSPSEIFHFPVPDFATGYREIEIIESYKQGSHMLMIGKVINTKTTSTAPLSLFHISFLQSLISNYQHIQ